MDDTKEDSGDYVQNMVDGEEWNEKFLLSELIVTQHGFRSQNREKLQQMINYVAKGGLFDDQELRRYKKEKHKETDRITLAKFERTEQTIPHCCTYIWDGHHRVLAMYLGGRNYIDPSEYRIITNFRYDLTAKKHLSSGFVTPFDPREEVRLPGFYDFKKEALEEIRRHNWSESEIDEYLEKNASRYKRKREFSTIGEMADHLQLEGMKVSDNKTRAKRIREEPEGVHSPCVSKY
eukprot:TRINITY_DN6981_c0_g1_i1.p1 TRINITY_DN6981_c0_g1~~TRINITY_DN6981_c0_g1_i1.p1  ORF type:complete len:253 (-),score=38.49 TRINITY_DN6981_c0_g1_i1:34-738(-)